MKEVFPVGAVRNNSVLTRLSASVNHVAAGKTYPPNKPLLKNVQKPVIEL